MRYTSPADRRILARWSVLHSGLILVVLLVLGVVLYRWWASRHLPTDGPGGWVTLGGALGFLAWFAFVPLLVALDRRLRAGASLRSLFGLGYGFGLVFFLIGIHWIALLSAVAITIPWLKYPAWVAAAALAMPQAIERSFATPITSPRLPVISVPCAISVPCPPSFERRASYTEG